MTCLNNRFYLLFSSDSSDMSGLNAIICAAGVDPSLLENSPDNNNPNNLANPPSATKRSTISHPKKNRLSTEALQAEMSLSAQSPAKTSLSPLLSSNTPMKETPVKLGEVSREEVLI